MTKDQENKMLKEHMLTDDKEFVRAYEENPPHIIEKLPWQPGEGIFSELSEGDKFQILTRYLNDNGVMNKNSLHFLVRIERLLTWLCEAQGIDVQAKFREDAKKKAEAMEQQLEASKAELKKAAERAQIKN